MNWGFTRLNAGIDLRKEIHNLLHGSSDVVQIGQWIIIRKYDLTKFSNYYNEITREGIGGPKYEYTDSLCLTYKWNNVIGDPFNERDTIIGQLDIPAVTFFFEYDINITENDEIYEFDWDDHSITPILTEIPKPYKAKYNIKLVQTYRLDNGRKEYIACRTVKENIKY